MVSLRPLDDQVHRLVPASPRASSPPSRTSGRVSRSGLALASQPWSPLGPSRPWLTRSSARPRTPTIRPSFDADVQAAAVGAEDADRLDPALAARGRPLVDADRPRALGMASAGPQTSWMLSRVRLRVAASAMIGPSPSPWRSHRASVSIRCDGRLHLLLAVLAIPDCPCGPDRLVSDDQDAGPRGTPTASSGRSTRRSR